MISTILDWPNDKYVHEYCWPTLKTLSEAFRALCVFRIPSRRGERLAREWLHMHGLRRERPELLVSSGRNLPRRSTIDGLEDVDSRGHVVPDMGFVAGDDEERKVSGPTHEVSHERRQQRELRDHQTHVVMTANAAMACVLPWISLSSASYSGESSGSPYR